MLDNICIITYVIHHVKKIYQKKFQTESGPETQAREQGKRLVKVERKPIGREMNARSETKEE